ncbi:hypothetical protein VTK56DRAFT_4643 [Thermocarpiscus australiensis]
MPGNVVKAFLTIGTVIKGAKTLVIGVATRTSYWIQPEALITETMKAQFRAAVEKDTRPLPPNAEKIVMREAPHGPDNHITVVILDGEDNYIESRYL